MFIDYVQKTASRIATLDFIVEECRRAEILIVTSTLSIVEVAFAENERPSGSLDPAKLAAVDAMWEDRTIMLLVEFNSVIAREAREIIRHAATRNRSLRSPDAVHLATARKLGVSVFQTYDAGLLRWDGEWFPVREPSASKPMLPLPPV